MYVLSLDVSRVSHSLMFTIFVSVHVLRVCLGMNSHWCFFFLLPTDQTVRVRQTSN